ncbi:MAG: peptidylprolyl isomerase [Nitrospinaceae bacterium]
MNRATFILLSFILLLPAGLMAKEQAFTLNGKPVPQVVATVNGVPLSSAILKRELFTFRIRSKQMGQEIKPEDEVTIGRELIKELVRREIVVQKAQSLGITITEKKIESQLKSIEDQFPSQKSFITALAFQHMTIEALKQKIHRTLLEDELIRWEVAPKVEVDENETKKYYDTHLTRFTKPVLYRLSHIHTATIKPSGGTEDEESREKAKRLTDLVNEEAKEKINSVLKRVQAGENFGDLAKRFSEDEASREMGGYLGDLHQGSTIPEIGETMIKLHEGETSSIIKSPYGYHILKLDEIIPSQLMPFSETKTDIMNLLLKRKTKKLFIEYVSDLKDNAKVQVFI